MENNPAADLPEPAARKLVFAPWMAGCMAALVLGFAVFGARPAIHWAKGVRARHFAAESEAFIAQGKWREAFSKAQAAYQLEPDEPDSLRAMARFYEIVSPRAALPFLRILAGLDTVTPRDLSEYAEACLQQGNLPEAQSQLGRLLQIEPANADNLRLAARVHAAMGDSEGSLRFAREAEKLEPQNLRGQFLRARLEILSKDAATRKSGWETVWLLCHDRGVVGLDSLRVLAHWSGLAPGQEAELTKLLRDHPLAKEADHVLGFEVNLRFHPERREEVLSQAIAEAKGADGEVLRGLGTWLNGLQEFNRTLALLPEKLATSRQDLFLVRLDALAALNRWSDVERLLAIKDVPLGDVYVHVFHARAEEEAGRKEAADFDWRRAHSSAMGNPSQMYYLAQYAEKTGREDQAELAYRSLAADVPTAMLGYQSLLRLAQARGDAEGARSLLGEMMKQWQSQPEVRNDYAYLNVLLGKNLVEGRGIAFGLVSALPAELPHRTTLALALLRLNDPVSAFNVYEGLKIPWASVPDRDKAVYVAVLGANGKKEEAGRMAATIAMGNLFKEERDLVRPWLKQPQAFQAPSRNPVLLCSNKTEGPMG